MKRFIPFLILFALIATPAKAAAFEVSGWIPYWASTDGTKSAREHIETLSVVMPFSHSLQPSGELKDLASMKKSSWKRLVREAAKEDVPVLPTVMASDGAVIHSLLSDERKREDLVEEVAGLAEDYDGVDIDFEGKRASTRPYFALFLKELKKELKGKTLSCTIEARTPPASLYRVVPATMEYANDLKEIGRHCDRVNVMTYDQQRADLTLNDARKGAPYYPVADPDWVRKVVNLMDNDIPKNKLHIGIATYGREVRLKVSPEWFESYSSVRSVNPDDAKKAAKKAKVKPSENKAGEQSFSYLPKGSDIRLSELPKAPRGTSSGDEVALRALEYANKTGETVYVNLVWWSDAKAIEDKVELAKELGVAGVVLFKIDGEEDEKLWDLF